MHLSPQRVLPKPEVAILSPSYSIISLHFFSLKHLLVSEIFLIIYLWNSVRVGTLCELFSVVSLAPVTLYITGRFTSAVSLGLHLISSLLKFLFVLTYFIWSFLPNVIIFFFMCFPLNFSEFLFKFVY